MIIVRPRYIVNEHSWEAKVPERPYDLTETTLTVSFDHGAQRLFSSVRINVTHNFKNVSTETIVGKWKFTPASPPSPTIDVDPVFSESVPLETERVRPNPSSLPILNVDFEIESVVFPGVWDVVLNSRKIGGPSPRGGLTFKHSRDRLHQTLLEVNKPLTADTLSVSASFTCSPLLYTPGQWGSGLSLDNSSTVGRIVHVRPVVPLHEPRTVPLPTEVLYMIFRNFSESSDVYSRWRRDLLSCGLVCKQWTCALDLNLLLSDFHYPEARRRQTRNAYPPEIHSFASALASCPSLAESITHLSPDYFLEHGLWKTLSDVLIPSAFQQRAMLSYVVTDRIEGFVGSFLSILRLAKNLRSLSFSSRWNVGMPDDFLEALRGLNRIEEVDLRGEFNTVHQAYLAAWSSLKRLNMAISGHEGPVPETPPRYALTDATLSMSLKDEYLNYVLSASSSLERLVLQSPSWLTNAGLHSALGSVSKCLVTLWIDRGVSRPDKEEHALDSIIVQMVRLEHLVISPFIATHLMIERRSEAFKRSCMLDSPTTLPIIKLLIGLGTVPKSSRENGLLAAASQVWPGWAIDTSCEPPK